MPPETALQTFVLNEGRWPENLPPKRRGSVESYAEAFTRAIAKESTISPEQFDLSLYKRQGGRPLTGTPWRTRGARRDRNTQASQGRRWLRLPLDGQAAPVTRRGRVETRADDGFRTFQWSHGPQNRWGRGNAYSAWLADRGVPPAGIATPPACR